MSSLALGVAGAIGANILFPGGGAILWGLTASQIGGFVGTAVGGLVDNMLFPTHTEGPKLDDLTVTVSTYGNIIPLPYGPENRITGNVFWSTGLIQSSRQSGGKGSPASVTTTYTYRTSLAVALGAGPATADVIIKKIWANAAVIYDVTDPLNNTSQLYSAIRIYPGTLTQGPDPSIEADLGVGLTPGYIGTIYVVITDLQLADYGNQIPNLEFLLAAQDEIDVATVALDICKRCGVDPNTVSTAGIAGAVRGFVIAQASSGVGALQPLALAYNFDGGEDAGSLVMLNRDSAPAGTITLDHMAAHDASDDRPAAITWSRSAEVNLPQQTVVNFMDPAIDYQRNTQGTTRTAGNAQNNLSTDVAIVLTTDQGRQLADRMMWTAWLGRQTAELQVDDRWIGMRVGRKYMIETVAGAEPVRVTSKTRGANGVHQLAIVRDSVDLYQSTAQGQTPTIPPNKLSTPGQTELIILDIPVLNNVDATNKPYGWYWGVVGSGPPGWRGADLIRGQADETLFGEVGPVGVETIAGEVLNILGPDDEAQSQPFDSVNTILVQLRRPDMTIESHSEADISVGVNAVYIGPADGHGGEIVQFLDATPTGTPGQYLLTNLYRGLLGTDFACDSHGTGELFVLMEPGKLQRAEYGFADLGIEHAYRAISLLTSPADAPSIFWTNTGVGIRPYRPIHLELTGSSGHDLVLSWFGRARPGQTLADFQAEPFMVRIMTEFTGIVVREVTISIDQFFTYTLAMQTADFGGSPPHHLRWRVAQVGVVYGPGIFNEWYGPV